MVNISGFYQNTIPWPIQKYFRKLKYKIGVWREIDKLPAGRLPYLAKSVRLMKGRFPRECPICAYSGHFLAYGYPPRFDAECPSCGSLERHRLFFLRCIQTGGIAERASILHFAPEPILSRLLRERVGDYRTADISGAGVDLVLNIEKIEMPDASFDAVIANHVLEHVDDRAAMTEIRRILKDDGTFYCMVPIIEGWDETYENGAISTEEDRELHFGQNDHVRYYGRDFRDRLRRAGFDVVEYTAQGEDVIKYSLVRGEKLFVCRKTAS